jgi:hypothetical protein
MMTGAALGRRKEGIPLHGFGDSLFWWDMRQTGTVTRFKMYANGCYWEVVRGDDDLWVTGMRKTGFFPVPGIRLLLLDPIWRDGIGNFPDERSLH